MKKIETIGILLFFCVIYQQAPQGQGSLRKVAEGRIEKTQQGAFSVDDMADVGIDEGTWVADYGSSSKFTGKINKVNIEIKK